MCSSDLGLERLTDYDRYAPIGEPPGSFAFERAQSLVLDAYGDFAPAMAEIAGRFFAGRWIDAEIRPDRF